MTAGWRSGSRQESPGKKKRPRGLKRPGSLGMAAPTGEYSRGWGSRDAGWDGSCSGKGTGKGGPTGETPMVGAPAMRVGTAAAC